MPLSIKIPILITLSTILVISAVSYLEYRIGRSAMEVSLIQDAVNLSERLAVSLQKPVWDFDIAGLQNILESEMNNMSVVSIIIMKPDKKEVYNGVRRNGSTIEESKEIPIESDLVFRMKNIEIHGDTIGHVVTYLTRSVNQAALKNALIRLLKFYSIATFILILFTVTLMRFSVLRPLDKLRIAINRMQQQQSENAGLQGDTGEGSCDVDRLINMKRNDEIGSLSKSFVEMRNTIHEKIALTKTQNISLESALEKLTTEMKERKRAEKELSNHRDNLEELVEKRTTDLVNANKSLEQLKTAIEQSIDGIVVMDMNGDIQYSNNSWATMHGFSIEEINKKHINFFHTEQQVKEDVEPFFDDIMNCGSFEGEVGHIDNNQCEFPTWMSVTQMKDSSGVPIGIVGIARDISQQKEAEEQLEQVNKQLVETAHRAGMADIATNTLHNVGNILNSVTTSSQFILNIMDKTELKSLEKAANMLTDNMERIEDFIISDGKGRKLMRYIIKTKENLFKEFDTIKDHILRLAEKIEVISEVIASQQSYAVSRSMTEKHVLADIIDDAVTMQSGTIDRFRITIETDHQPVPEIPIQKTKLIHIIINLIKNAKEAMLDTEPDKRKLKITSQKDSTGTYVKITDTGEGVSKENLRKIFNHGFTTKKTGHGFGLHSSANYMTEMGGEIWAESEGMGKGTTFVLKFPF